MSSTRVCFLHKIEFISTARIVLIRYLHSWRYQGHDTMVCKSLHKKKFCQNTNLALSLLNYHPLIPRPVICHFGLKFCRYSSTKSSLFSFSEWRCWMSKAAAITDGISNGSLIKWFFKINYAALPWESFPSRFTENYFSVAPWDVWGLNSDILYGVIDAAASLWNMYLRWIKAQ